MSKEDLVGLYQGGYGDFWPVSRGCSGRDQWRLKIREGDRLTQVYLENGC